MSVDPLVCGGMYEDRMDATDEARDQNEFTVADGSRVSIMLDRAETDGKIDVIEITMGPGGGPPPHRHPYGEWFRVLEGELTMCEEQDGTIVVTTTLSAGDAVWIAPHTWHGTLNLSDENAHYEVISVPGTMSGALREGGIRVAEGAEDYPPLTMMREIAARWGIEFWSGPTDLPPLPG